MANTYKDIVITPNKSSSTDDPKIVFSGANASVNTDITLRVYPESNGTLSFEGSAGQLFSITNDLTGSIFSVNDISGIPSIDVQANGVVSISPYGGNVAIDSTSLFVDTVGNKIGIGRTNPGYTVDVVGTVNASSVLVNGVAISAGVTITDQTTSSSTFYPVLTDITSGTETTANVSSTKLYFVPSTGTLSATIFNTLSDRTIKDNISEFDGLTLLNNIDPVSFTWKDNGNKSYGVIAQELEKVLPELVDTNENGLKSVSYIPMIAMLIDVVKKQQKELEDIRNLLNK